MEPQADATHPTDRPLNLVWIVIAAIGGGMFLAIVTVVTTTGAGGAWWALVAIPAVLWAVSGVLARTAIRRPYEYEHVEDAGGGGGEARR
jgi:threonine/homoserine efflux transporter RhtA